MFYPLFEGNATVSVTVDEWQINCNLINSWIKKQRPRNIREKKNWKENAFLFISFELEIVWARDFSNWKGNLNRLFLVLHYISNNFEGFDSTAFYFSELSYFKLLTLAPHEVNAIDWSAIVNCQYRWMT